MRIVIILALASLGAGFAVVLYVVGTHRRGKRAIVPEGTNGVRRNEAQPNVESETPTQTKASDKVQPEFETPSVMVERIAEGVLEADSSHGGRRTEPGLKDEITVLAEHSAAGASEAAVDEQRLREQSPITQPLSLATRVQPLDIKVDTEGDSDVVVGTNSFYEAASNTVPRTISLEPKAKEEKSDSRPSTPPSYLGLAPPPRTLTPRPSSGENRRPSSGAGAALDIRVQLIFDRHGGVRTLALVPDRRNGMSDELEISCTHGELRRTELRDDCYEAVQIIDAGKALREGIEWRGCGEARRWRWVLSGREIYVLAPGAEFGLHGFVSTPRMWLNARHAVLATARLRDEVHTALAQSGCAIPDVSDATMPGVPSGWLLFRDVMPTRATPMRGEAHILNVLCPSPDIQPHFIGGIRLSSRTWLAGYPPRIRFTGALGNDFHVMIDGQSARIAADAAFEASGWDIEGEHRLWFGGQSVTYALRVMDEGWDGWPAHDFGAGTAICGARIQWLDDARWRQVRVPVTNPVLVGARPGEIFHCRLRNDVRCETILTLAPFTPVWALPLDALHVDKRSARIVLIHAIEPIAAGAKHRGHRTAPPGFARWIAVINDARRKDLSLAVENCENKALWHRYRTVAKQLWRAMR